MLVNKIVKGISAYLVFALILAGLNGFSSAGSSISSENILLATSFTVKSDGTGDYPTIQSAIKNASDGDTINVWAGTYYENINVNKKINLIGNGSSNSIIDGGKNGTVVKISANSVTISGFTITNSSTNQGANDVGIMLLSVKFVTVSRNVVSYNGNGIVISGGGDNTIDNNTCRNNSYSGIRASSNNNRILFNNCTYNSDGIYILSSVYNVLNHNTCNRNSGNGIYLSSSSQNKLHDNECSWNSDNVNNYWIGNKNFGIIAIASSYNIITNNECNYNEIGIELGTLAGNITLVGKVGYGYNTVMYNKVEGNTYYGVDFSRASFGNTFMYNEINANKIGIHMNAGNYNKIKENTVSNSLATGIYLDIPFHDNVVYHNNIINNKYQACDLNPIVINYWYHPAVGGNYWSDYDGDDNGKWNRIIGDGIGDTRVPFHKLDFFPFLEPNGWRYPGRPKLNDPDALNTNGTILLTWSTTLRTVSYMLEEDTKAHFPSPTVIYSGPNPYYTIENQPNGTYYYRVRAYSEYNEFRISNIVTTTVDWKPAQPADFYIKNINGHEVSLAWTQNTEPDLEGYLLLVNATGKNASGPFRLFEKLLPNITEYTATNLDDDTTYHFALAAFDTLLTNSTHSLITATTLDVTPPSTPTHINVVVLSDTEVNLSWRGGSEPDTAGYIICINETGNGPAGSFYPAYTVLGRKTSYFIVPDLAEQTLYHFKIQAMDEVPNISPGSKVVSAKTYDLTAPNTPTGVSISNPTHNSLTISWYPNTDHDLVGYKVYRRHNLTEEYKRITYRPIDEIYLIDTNLDEVTTYYYVVSAVDDVGHESVWTEPINGTTLLGQYGPEVGETPDSIIIPEDCYDDSSINLMDWFSDINNDILRFRCEGENNIKVTIYDLNGTVILQPGSEWFGRESLVFYAADEFAEVLADVTVIVAPVNDPPESIEIVSPKNGIEIQEGESLFLNGRCSDSDQRYGDKLNYRWYSEQAGELGEGKSLNISFHDYGDYQITLEVTDKTGLNANITINVSVLRRGSETTTGSQGDHEEKQSKDEEGNNVYIIAGLILIPVILIIIFTLFVLIRRKRRIEDSKSKEAEKGIKVNMITDPDGKRSGIKVPSSPKPIMLKEGKFGKFSDKPLLPPSKPRKKKTVKGKGSEDSKESKQHKGKEPEEDELVVEGHLSEEELEEILREEDEAIIDD